MTPPLLTLASAAELIRARRAEFDPTAALLVGLSGIDGAGKGWVAEQLAAQLTEAGLRVAVVGVDGWLNLPRVRFADREPGPHFYFNALRLEPFTRDLLLPLRANRRVDLVMQYAAEQAHQFQVGRVMHEDVDVILAEGIFLFRRDIREIYDLAIWVECSFETAVARAVERAQEGLSPEATRLAYQRIYIPAQRLHFMRDRPAALADYWLLNDFALGD